MIDGVIDTCYIDIILIPDTTLPPAGIVFYRQPYFGIRSTKFNIQVPCVLVTCAPRLYIKVYEIVASKKMKLFVRLCEFHQLMSFLDSVGNL